MHLNNMERTRILRAPAYSMGHEVTEEVWDNLFDEDFLKFLCEINLASKGEVNGETYYTPDDLLKSSRFD